MRKNALTAYNLPPNIQRCIPGLMAKKLVTKFNTYWSALKCPALETEFRFHPERKWQFDYAHPATKIAIELEGGIWTGGRHTRGKGFEKDCEKYNEAVLAGWSVWRLTGDMINTRNIERIAAAIQAKEAQAFTKGEQQP